LISETGEIKVCDFGLCHKINDRNSFN